MPLRSNGTQCSAPGAGDKPYAAKRSAIHRATRRLSAEPAPRPCSAGFAKTFTVAARLSRDTSPELDTNDGAGKGSTSLASSQRPGGALGGATGALAAGGAGASRGRGTATIGTGDPQPATKIDTPKDTQNVRAA